MVKINGINLGVMRNDKHFQFCRDFAVVMAKFDPEELKVKPQFDEWTERFNLEDAALKKIVKSPLTQKINDADRLRDNTYSGMADIVHAYLKCNDAPSFEAAARLKIVFDTYGDVARKPLKEETSAVYNILQELKGAYAADCAKIKIDSWVMRLGVENAAFDGLMTSRFDESAAKCSVVLKEARRDVDESFRKICGLIAAYMILEGEAAYEPFVKRLNEVIKKYAVKSGRHRGGASSGDEEDAPYEGAEDGGESAGGAAGEGGASP